MGMQSPRVWQHPRVSRGGFCEKVTFQRGQEDKGSHQQPLQRGKCGCMTVFLVVYPVLRPMQPGQTLERVTIHM